MVVSLCQCTHESHWKVTDKLAVVDVRHDRSRQFFTDRRCRPKLLVFCIWVTMLTRIENWVGYKLLAGYARH